MYDRSMPDRHSIGDDARKSRVSVQANQVLNVGFTADDDTIRVSPHHRTKQYGGAISHLYVTSQDGIWRYVAIRTDQIGPEGVVVRFVHGSSKAKVRYKRIRIIAIVSTLLRSTVQLFTSFLPVKVLSVEHL
jgi:hypothetical protein